MDSHVHTQRLQGLKGQSAPSGSQFGFDVYHLDLSNAQLWRGSQALPLTAKALGVLGVLMAHAGELASKDALFRSVWPEATVSDQSLTNCISELRKALGETANQPRFIQTVHRRGYRFLAPVTVLEPLAPVAAGETLPPPPHWPTAGLPLFVGRAPELAALHQHLAQALRGQHQVVMISGEAGLGKTSVMDAFLASQPPELTLWVAWGHCLDQYGAGEAYLPLLDALGRLG
jgi:DNA-binding winged helix-turn-helix (wHTH) protein